jgi:hypothetical protein
MAKEPDNLVLKMLREIRATLGKHEQRFAKIDGRFDKVDKTLGGMSGSLACALGFPMQANLRHEGVQTPLDALERRVTKPEERV